MNYNTYDVAVMNYPLFNKTNIDHHVRNIFEQPIQEDVEVPIYIHIPFCDSLCDFCIYNRMLKPKSLDMIQSYVDALIREIKLYASHDYIKEQRIGSVFIGGGTPTVLSVKQLYSIIITLKKCFNINHCEMSIECNPHNADYPKLKRLKNLGITRVSTGVQTFNDDMRKRLHIQNSSQAIMNWFEKVKTLSFDDISMDLIFGFPETNTAYFLNDVKKAVALNLGHLSIYKLTLFAYTKLYKDIQKNKKMSLPTQEQMYDMFSKSHEYILNHNYSIQSTQEYSKKGKTVKFWDLTYDGYGNNISFGSSSFGYINGYCYQNQRTINGYISKVKDNKLPIERISSQITYTQQKERAMVIGFRKGFVYKEMFFKTFHTQIIHEFSSQINNQISKDLIYENKDGYGLTSKGLYHQGLVSADYMGSIFKNVSPLKKKMCIGLHEMPY